MRLASMQDAQEDDSNTAKRIPRIWDACDFRKWPEELALIRNVLLEARS